MIMHIQLLLDDGTIVVDISHPQVESYDFAWTVDSFPIIENNKALYGFKVEIDSKPISTKIENKS